MRVRTLICQPLALSYPKPVSPPALPPLRVAENSSVTFRESSVLMAVVAIMGMTEIKRGTSWRGHLSCALWGVGQGKALE